MAGGGAGVGWWGGRLEQEEGGFVVQFAFFDNDVYDYELYRGKNYDLVMDDLPWEAAAMVSEKRNISLGPGERKLVNIWTEKKYPDALYWVYGQVDAPKVADCVIVEVLRNVTKNKTVMKDRADVDVAEEVEWVKLRVWLWRLIVE